jgi:hypothetical protein
MKKRYRGLRASTEYLGLNSRTFSKYAERGEIEPAGVLISEHGRAIPIYEEAELDRMKKTLTPKWIPFQSRIKAEATK